MEKRLFWQLVRHRRKIPAEIGSLAVVSTFQQTNFPIIYDATSGPRLYTVREAHIRRLRNSKRGFATAVPKQNVMLHEIAQYM